MPFNPHNKTSEVEVPVGIVIDRSTRVYIANIPLSRIESDGDNALKTEFSEIGPVEFYVLHKDGYGRFTGSALCTYRNPADAKLAIKKLNDSEIDGETIKVSQARDDGVVLASQLRRYARREDHVSKDDEKWSHDKFDLMQQGVDVFRGRGRGRGGRGRGGYINSVDRMEASFESYVANRDAAKTQSNAPAVGEGTAEKEEGSGSSLPLDPLVSNV